jgi:hypothetical protein
MDSYDGKADNPPSLHKYLYGHADPANGRDPSGHSWLSELTIVQWAQNTIRIVVAPTAQRLGTTVLYNIYRGIMVAEKGAVIAEYVGVGVGLLGVAAEGADRIAQNLLENSEQITDGPYPEQFKRGSSIDRIGNGNLSGGGNVTLIDDLDGNGVGTSLRSHSLAGGEEAYLKAIQDDAREVSRARTEVVYGTNGAGRYVEFRPGTVRATALVVAIPENEIRMTLSPSFRNALRAYRDTYRTAIQVVPVRGWRK